MPKEGETPERKGALDKISKELDALEEKVATKDTEPQIAGSKKESKEGMPPEDSRTLILRYPKDSLFGIIVRLYIIISQTLFFPLALIKREWLLALRSVVMLLSVLPAVNIRASHWYYQRYGTPLPHDIGFALCALLMMFGSALLLNP